MPRHFNKRDAAKLARLAGLSLLLPGCLTNSPKAVVTDASVTESKIADNAVTTTKIRAGNVMTDNIQDGAITSAKLASGVVITGTSGTWTGSGSFGTTLTVGTGLTVTAGGATLTAGNLLLSAGNATITGNLTTTGTSTFGDSAQLDTHTMNGLFTHNYTADPTLTGAATDASIVNATTASPTGVSSRSYRGISNLLTAAPTASVAVVADGNYAAADNQLLLSPTVAQPNMTGWGSINIARLNTPLATGQLVGTFGRAHNSDIDTVSTGIGVLGEVYNDTTGTVSFAYGNKSVITNATTGTLNTAYGYHAKLDNQAGTVTNYIGIYLQDPADPTNATPTALAGTRYGVVADGPAVTSFFEGNIGIGAGKTNPAATASIDALKDINSDSCVSASGVAAGGVCLSDRRVKKDIHDFTYGLEDLLKLRPRAYKLNGLGGTKKDRAAVGFIAQELEEAIPEFVVKDKIKLHEQDKAETEVEKVNYSNFLYVAINAIKELYAKWFADHQQLGEQKQKLAALERKIELENIALRSENRQLKDRLEKIEQALALGTPPQVEKKKGRKLASK